MIQNFKNGIESFLKKILISNPLNCIVIILVTIISYGGLLFSKTINNDYCFFIYSDPLSLIRQNRWGRSLLALVGFLDRDVPVWSDCLGIVFFVISAFLFAFVWYKVSQGRVSLTALLFFILLYLSYPLTFEIAVYPTFLLEMGICYSIIGFSFALLVSSEHSFSWKEIFIISFLNSIVFACYESFVFTYILLVFLMAFIVNHLQCDNSTIKIKYFLIVFICSIILRSVGIFLVNISMLKTLSTDLGNNGPATAIAWLYPSCLWGTRMIRLMVDLGYRYVYIGIIYFAIFMFVISFFILIYYSLVNKKKMLMLLLGIIISLFGLSFLQGSAQPYRTCQSFPLFIGFTGMLLYSSTKFKKIVFGLIVFCTLMQMKELCIWQNYDIEQSNKLMHNIFLIEQDLRQIPTIEAKDIIFCGEHINDVDIRKSMALPLFYSIPIASDKRISTDTGLNRLDNSIQFRLTFEYFTHLKVKVLPKDEMQKIAQFIIKNKIPDFPRNGYIFQDNDRVVVNLGIANPQKTPKINRRNLIKQKIKNFWR